MPSTSPSASPRSGCGRRSEGVLFYCTANVRLAQSRHGRVQYTCPLLGVKRTSPGALHMSAFDPKRTLLVRTRNSWGRRRNGRRDQIIALARHAMTCLRQKLSWRSCFSCRAARLAGILCEKIARRRSSLSPQRHSRQPQTRFPSSLGHLRNLSERCNSPPLRAKRLCLNVYFCFWRA